MYLANKKAQIKTKGACVMGLSSDLLRGYTDTIILNHLRDGPSYGYRINKHISEKSSGAFELKEATLYTAFRRLEGGGLIRSFWGDEQTGARRRYYALTPQGEEKLTSDLANWDATRKLIDRLLDQDAISTGE